METKKPKGEDFFIFSIIQDDPDHPTWEYRKSVMGDWETTRKITGDLINAWAASKPKHQIKVALYQGEGARKYLAWSMAEESKFNNERAAVPNN